MNWPKCSVVMRNGETVSGEIADERPEDSTVRVRTAEKLTEGAYGKQSIDYAYLDIRNQFITKIP